MTRGAVVIIGFPHDEGVARNGGRVGARGGPAVFRRHLARTGTLVNPEYGVDVRTVPVLDLGDVDGELGFDEAHAALRQLVAGVVSRGGVPFVVGGGNDQSYANARGTLDGLGASEHAVRLTAVNVDAHFDVRPQKDGLEHSGSPFRLLLEDGDFGRGGGRFVEFAAQGLACSNAHYEYLQAMSVPVVWLSDVPDTAAVRQSFREHTADADNLFLSFDLDSVSGADAPGVSAVAAIGLSARDALEICLTAGRHDKLRVVDLSEFNPDVEDHRTGRLVALMFYYTLLGRALRLASQ